MNQGTGLKRLGQPLSGLQRQNDGQDYLCQVIGLCVVVIHLVKQFYIDKLISFLIPTVTVNPFDPFLGPDTIYYYIGLFRAGIRDIQLFLCIKRSWATLSNNSSIRYLEKDKFDDIQPENTFVLSLLLYPLLPVFLFFFFTYFSVQLFRPKCFIVPDGKYYFYDIVPYDFDSQTFKQYRQLLFLISQQNGG